MVLAMDEHVPDPSPEDAPRSAAPAEARDAGVRLIRRATGWLVAGAVTCAGVVSVAAADAFHGHTVSTGSASTSSASPAPAQPSAPQSTGNGAGLQAPAQVPAPASLPSSPVVSGGS